MTLLFGLPTSLLALIFAAVLVVGLLILVGLALRQPVLMKLGLRNIGRRPTQTVLIAVGLLLSTMLITTALGVGDVITGAIRSVAVSSLGRIDELAYASWNQTPFSLSNVSDNIATLRRDPAIGGAMPIAETDGLLLSDLQSRQTAKVNLIGVPAQIPPIFGPLHGGGATLVDPATLGPTDVLINTPLAATLVPQSGDRLYLFHNGQRTLLHVRGIVSAPGLTGTKFAALMNIDAVATLGGFPGLATAIAVANPGPAATSADGAWPAVQAIETTLPGFKADPVKREGVDTFAGAQSVFTRVFLLFTLFAGAISGLLIVLVFTLLAAERRGEMGVSRALGMGRGSLIQIFLFEGAAYDLGSAVLGVAAGLALGAELASVIAAQLAPLGITGAGQVEPASLALAYGLGAVLTGLTMTLASWSTARLNIVSAIRGEPDDPRAHGAVAAVARVRRALGLAAQALSSTRWRPGLALRALTRDLATAGLALVWRLVVGGLPLLALGSILLLFGISVLDPALFAAGATSTVLGATLLLRVGLRLARVSPRLADRLAVTPGGLALVAYWALPTSAFDSLGWPRFQDGIEVFFVAGVMMVLGAALVAIYNIDLVLKPLVAFLALLGRAATARVALAYPLQHKARGGLALAMFSMVAFTLTVMAVIITATAYSFGDLTRAGNGFDLSAVTAFGAPTNVEAATTGLPYLPRGVVSVAASSTLTPIGVVDLAAPRPAWSLYALDRVGNEFLSATTLHLTTRAAGYTSDAAVWRALRTTPRLAVVDSGAVPSANGAPVQLPVSLPSTYANAPLFTLAGVHAGDTVMPATPVWIADPTAGRSVKLTIIGVIDGRAAATYGVITAASNVAGAGFPAAPPTTFYFKAAPGVSAHMAARRVASAYLDYGLQATVSSEQLLNGLGPKQVLSAVLQGFVALTGLMGVAALGLIAARAVVERRHSVGAMRALGYTRGMVGAAFLTEALFTAVLGLVIGGVLGLVLSSNLFAANFFEQYRTGLSFVIPWQTLGVLSGAILLATLLMTALPAWQDSHIAPAEALRYEG